MNIHGCRSTAVAVAVAVVSAACSESRPAPMASSPTALRPADAPTAILTADVSVRIAPEGGAARREMRYHMRRSKRDGGWHASLLLPPMASGMPEEHDLARIEIDPDGVTRSYNRAGSEMKLARRPERLRASNPMLAQLEASLARSASVPSAGRNPALQQQYLFHARDARNARDSLVRRYGAPQLRQGREIFTGTQGESRSVLEFDPRIGAVVGAQVEGRNGKVDVSMAYAEVQPGLFVRSGMTYVLTLPGMKTPIRSETLLRNIHVEGQP